MINEEFNWIELRTIVILLGEYNNWWSANVFTEKGEQFLEYVFPTTKKLAAHQLSVEICRIDHDYHIGLSKYHLFRLPTKLEERIFTQLNASNREIKIPSAEQLIASLSDLAGNIALSPKEGPVLIGFHTELNDINIFQSFAKCYLVAFTNKSKTWPYLN